MAADGAPRRGAALQPGAFARRGHAAVPGGGLVPDRAQRSQASQGRARICKAGAAARAAGLSADHPQPARNAIRMQVETQLAKLGARPTVALEIDGVEAILTWSPTATASPCSPSTPCALRASRRPIFLGPSSGLGCAASSRSHCRARDLPRRSSAPRYHCCRLSESRRFNTLAEPARTRVQAVSLRTRTGNGWHRHEADFRRPAQNSMSSSSISSGSSLAASIHSIISGKRAG